MSLITLSAPWQFGLLASGAALWVLVRLSDQVRGFLAGQGALALWQPSVAHGLGMGYALALGVLVLAPVRETPFNTLSGCFLVLYLFRLALTDALAGWLPQSFTWSCLSAGLLVAMGNGEFWSRAASCVVLFTALSLFYWISRERFGLGDVWLLTALAAWFAMPSVLVITAMGLCGFVVWHGVLGNGRRGGPLGPWLGHSAVGMLIFIRYDPLILW